MENDRDAEEGGRLGFEQALAALEAEVVRLESGELALEEALQAFERGVALVRALQERLRAAEERIQVLTRDADGRPQVRPADEDEP